MRNLTEDPKTRDFAVTNGLKTLGIIAVIIGHRVALSLGLPSYDSEFSQHVWKSNHFFSYVVIFFIQFHLSVFILQIFNDVGWSFLKSPVAVEIFFVISGFFTYILIEERLSSGKSLKFMYLMIYRIIRCWINIILAKTLT